MTSTVIVSGAEGDVARDEGDMEVPEAGDGYDRRVDRLHVQRSGSHDGRNARVLRHIQRQAPTPSLHVT